MTTRLLLGALAIAWVVALAGLVWMMTLAQLRPHHAFLLLIHLDPVMRACVALSVVSAAIGILSLRAGARPRPLIGVGGAFGWGVLGALYGAASAQNMLICINPPIPFSIYAQPYAEALIVLLVGLTGALLGLGLLGLRSPR
ncbi:hypothetical protein [Brevundimonas sp.]|uniref:hypothetical protein n=1 Tax=Brevundimonas sp. TaxID=1871086 RepID=UPI0011FC50E9|nr:hypothetical protein [Brevundimonas sp.]TAJ63899.1 MAG: hypothetical protein EPO49_05595 [Brevundimonas sp.]